MIVEIPDDNSIIKWKAFGEEDWKYAEISDLITAYEKRPQGEWVHRDAQWDTCSNCGLGFRDLCLDGFKFCPNCGADMRGKKG